MTAESLATLLVLAVEGYLLLGLVFALPFVLFLAGRIDPNARHSSWGFRLLVIPSICLLWPLLLKRVIKGQQPPVECNAHRRRAEQLARGNRPKDEIS